MITIFTPTYNREKELNRLYNSDYKYDFYINENMFITLVSRIEKTDNFIYYRGRKLKKKELKKRYYWDIYYFNNFINWIFNLW